MQGEIHVLGYCLSDFRRSRQERVSELVVLVGPTEGCA